MTESNGLRWRQYSYRLVQWDWIVCAATERGADVLVKDGLIHPVTKTVKWYCCGIVK